MSISCIVIDDEPIARKGLEDYIRDIPSLEWKGSFRTAMEANTFLANQAVELVFLDINMPRLSGMDWYKTLTNPPEVIFTTAYREYALDGFELNATDYLLKPISFDRFLKAVNKVQQKLRASPGAVPDLTTPDDSFFIKEGHRLIRLNYRDVLFIESIKDYLFIYTPEKRYEVLLSLKQVAQDLPGDQFLRVHRSYVVALNKVNALEGNQLIVQDYKIPVSKAHREAVQEKIVKGRLWKR